MDPISKLSFSNRRKVKKVSFDYPKEIEGVNLQEGSITKATERNARVARLSDAIIGRSATVALGNSVVKITGGAAKVAGFVIQDPHLKERSQLRGLAPIYLRVSARVHRLSFRHPSLDITQRNNVSRSKSDRQNDFSPLVEEEQHRLSRDFIIEDHFYRKRNQLVKTNRLVATLRNEFHNRIFGRQSENDIHLATLKKPEQQRLSRDATIEEHINRTNSGATTHLQNTSGNATPDHTLVVKGKRLM